MTEVAGLTCIAERSGAQRQAVFAGTRGNADISVIEVAAGQPTGLQSFRLLLDDEENLQEGSATLGALAAITDRTSDAGGEAVRLRDPDGFLVELFRPVSASQLAAAA